MTWRLDEARAGDAEALGAILSDWIDETEWMPRLHSRAEDRAYCLELIGVGGVRVLRGPSGIAGFLARQHTEIPALYVAGRLRRQGHGRRLLDDAKALSLGRLSLWTFQANGVARAFYAREGFAEVEMSDGSRNDQGLPDVCLQWKSSR